MTYMKSYKVDGCIILMIYMKSMNLLFYKYDKKLIEGALINN